jgi:hypothetical protein
MCLSNHYKDKFMLYVFGMPCNKICSDLCPFPMQGKFPNDMSKVLRPENIVSLLRCRTIPN